MTTYFSETTNYYKEDNPEQLLKKYGSPLYVYSEEIFRKRCKEMATLVPYENFKVTYSIKANSNLSLLKIAKEEGLHADAMSPGEIFVLQEAGFKSDEIFYISNNVSNEEMMYAIDRDIVISVDSLSQLEVYGKIAPGKKVCVRLNPGVGAGHHEKVITAGKKTKFGINLDKIDKIKIIAKKYNLTICGINQHIGSLFMSGKNYTESVENVLIQAKKFENLEFVDFGGGFGVPYKKQEGEPRLELQQFGQNLGKIFDKFAKEYGKKIIFRIEPGRYIVAESCILLGKVYTKKSNYEKLYIGTDLGFNVLLRPAMYDSHHEVEVYRNGKLVKDEQTENVSIVGNICETGDVLIKDRDLPIIEEGDIIGAMDAGAYGYSMCSNYNNRLRPAEVLINKDGQSSIIRRRDTLEDLLQNF